MGRVRNWIETRFSVMVRSLGLHRIEARSFWGPAARVNLILLVHNLIRSRVLLRMAGVELSARTLVSQHGVAKPGLKAFPGPPPRRKPRWGT